ncbi:MAG: EamA family transporter [Hyphomonadaceae bacterium]
MAAICLVWGLNFVVTRWVVTDGGVPPLFFAGIRFLGATLVLLPFLRPVPKNLGTLFAISMGIGVFNFSFMFVGLANAEASAVSVVAQLLVPFAVLMSVAFLGERIGWRRGAGIALAIAGTGLIVFDPVTFQMSTGLIFVAFAAFFASGASILMKRIPPMGTLQMQAWIGLFSFAPLFVASALFEPAGDGVTALLYGGWLIWLAVAFVVLMVSIFAQGLYYYLIKTYDVSLVSPLTIMAPVWGVILGVSLLNEPLTYRLALGATISLAGVYIILVRGNRGNQAGGS